MRPFLILAALAIFALVVGQCSTARAQIACGKHDDVVAELVKKFQEARSGVGTSKRLIFVELYRSKRTGTWTLLTTAKNGPTCIFISGEAWDDIPEEIEGKPINDNR